jgi:hypothetical protein
MENAFYLTKNKKKQISTVSDLSVFKFIIVLMMLFFTVMVHGQPFVSGDGTKGNPYLIENEAQLDSVRNYLSSHFKLADDIDLSSYSNWNPIGDVNNKFTGSFDGNNYSIQNFTLDNPTANAQGLFAYFAPGTAKDSIKNLALQNVQVNARDSIGALAGKVISGTLYNCSVEGSIQGNQRIGGLAGFISSSIVKQCNGNVSMTGNGRIGGLIGYLTSSTIMQSYCLGTITTDGTEIGGIASFATNSTCSITECFTDMTLTANNSIGGIIYGCNYGSITNNYSLSDIYSYGQAGGILSYGYNCNIQHNYSTGAIYGHQSGGIGSNNWGTSQVFKNCLAINAEVKSISQTENIGRIWGSPTTTLQSNFAWDSLYVSDSVITNGTQNNHNGENVSYTQIIDSVFYKDAGIWDTPWNFTTKWTMDTTNISLFPILREIPAEIQKLKHSQAIIWNQNLSGSIGDTILLNAHGFHYPITFTSGNDQIVNIVEDTAFLVGQGQTSITAHLLGNEFFDEATESHNATVFAQGNGTLSNPFTISNIDELNYIRDNLDAHYKLIADLDLSSIENWDPIGGTCGDDCDYEYFTGSFDGNNHTISNLTINLPNEYYIGLFGNFKPITPGDSIKNLTLINVNLLGQSTIGGVVGQTVNGSLVNCHVSGNIKATEDDAGGIVGNAETSHIENCTNNATIEANEGYTGGIVGSFYSGTITNCQSSGNIAGDGYLGGIAGYMNNSSMISCSNTGHISSNDSYTGGLAGSIYENSNIRNSYNLGNISGSSYAGGIIGNANNNCNIIKSYSGGQIYGYEYIGGIAGYAGNNSKINQCYSTSNLNPFGPSYQIGGIVGYLSNSTLLESYSTGKISGYEELGGIIGYASSSIIKTNVAMNASIGSDITVGRIVAVNSASTLIDNYAWEDMYVGGVLIETGTTNNGDGYNTPYDMLTTESFYTNSLLFTQQIWNFDTTWVMNPAISPYPILSDIDINAQKVKHAQSITWLQDIATPVGDTLKLTAVGGRTSSEIDYSSFNPEIAHINIDTMFVNTLGATQIMAYVEGNEFFAADSIIKTIVNFENAGTEEDPYLIYNADELNAVRCDVYAHYKLMNDIDLTPYENWNPIGNNNSEFYGFFDGNNYTISNLTINRPNEYYIGLFGTINESPGVGNKKKTCDKEKIMTGEIKNLKIENANINGKEYVGILAGVIANSDSIYNIHASGNVVGTYYATGGITGGLISSNIDKCNINATIIGNSSAGGLAGFTENSTISNSYFVGTIESTSYGTGGISGELYTSTLENCFSAGTISSYYQAGGIGGYASNSNIENSYSIADILVTEDEAGGIVGHISKSSVTNCYSTGFINSETARSTGGIVGEAFVWSSGSNTVKNNIAISAKVTGQSINTGRVMGRIYGSITKSNNYAWDDMYINDSKITTGTHDNKNGQNTTIDAVKGNAFYTFAANWDTEVWNFNDIWEMNPTVSPYPILKTIESNAQKVQHTQVISTPLPQALPTDGTVEDSLLLEGIADGPSELIAYNSNDALIAIVSGDTLIAKGVGTTDINLFFPETEFYKQSNMLGQPYTVTNKANHTVTWDQILSDMTYGEITIELDGTTSSGYPVEYSSSNEDVATIDGNTMTITGAGSTTITAYHSGNQGYNPSLNEIDQSFNVAQLELTIGGSFTVQDKDYDGTTTATIANNNLVLQTLVNGDDVSLSDIEATFATPEIGNNIEVTIVSATLTGANAYSYTLSMDGAPTSTGNITDGTGINNLTEDVSIYPNPFKNEIHIKTDKNINSVVILNGVGQIIQLEKSDLQTINTQSFNSGIYIIQIYLSDGTIEQHKLIKE